MRNLDEMRRLARMARNVGQPDLALEKAIAREEALQRKLFRQSQPPPLTEDKIFTPVKTMVDKVVEAIPSLPQAQHQEPLNEKLRDAELDGIRKQISDLITKMGTLSWGGGGTGVVNFRDLDDHQHPTDIRILEFNTAGAGTPVIPAGSLTWNPDEECLNVHQPDGTTLQAGLESYIRVHNDTGTILDHGELVMFTGVEEPYPGVNEHVPMVDRFVANGAYPPIYVVGVMTEPVANAENGRATTFGKVRELDTTGTTVSETWAIGDLLWAHPTIPGKLTKVRPTAPNIAVSVAAVLHVDATNGEILVRPSIFPQLHTGTFYSNVAQTAVQANTAYPITFNNSGLKCPHVSVANSSEVICEDQGLYRFEFRLHLQAPKNQSGRVWIWGRKNGVDIPESATELSLYGSGTIEATLFPSWSFLQSMDANNWFQLMWATDNTAIKIFQPEPTAFAPASRSAVIRVLQVNL